MLVAEDDVAFALAVEEEEGDEDDSSRRTSSGAPDCGCCGVDMWASGAYWQFMRCLSDLLSLLFLSALVSVSVSLGPRCCEVFLRLSERRMVGLVIGIYMRRQMKYCRDMQSAMNPHRRSNTCTTCTCYEYESIS